MNNWGDILSALDDKLAQLSAMKGSQFFFAPFHDEGERYAKIFDTLGSSCRLLMDVQRRWVYLEPIFVRGSIPSHQQPFDEADTQFRNMMTALNNKPQLPSLYNIDDLYSKVDNMKKKLDTCYDALSNFLETKREIFPRFYFISDTDLLEILGQAQNPSVIQTHLKKLFQGIHRVQFSNKQPPEIVATISAAGEVMQLAQPVAVVDSVENWLNSLTNEMRFTLSKLLEEALQKVSLLSKKNTLDSYLEYVKHFPSQILSLAEMISFTNNCEEHIKNSSLSPLCLIF